MYKLALPPLVKNSSRILILGTMPGDQSIAKQEYYANKGNHFWKIMFAIFNHTYSTSYQERKNLLQSHRIALWNVLAKCERAGSSDSKIINEEINDFNSFYFQFPDIKYIYFSKVNLQHAIITNMQNHQNIFCTISCHLQVVCMLQFHYQRKYNVGEN